jgi:hypothetical protein
VGEFGGGLDLLDVAAGRSGLQFRSGCEFVGDDRGVVEDDAEEVVEVVGYSAGELTEDFQAWFWCSWGL